MNSEIQDRKWFWGGIGLQFATGYVIAYLVYTIGTLITAPASVNIVAAIIGLAVVVAIGAVLWYIHRSKEKGIPCIGCPDSAKCSGNCAGCSGNCSGCGGSDNKK